MGRPDAGEGVAREGEVNAANEEGERKEEARLDLTGGDAERGREKRALQQQARKDVRIVGRRHDLQPVMEQILAGGVDVKESRSGMEEMEARIVAMDFIEVFRAVDLQGIHRNIASLVPWGGKEQSPIRRYEKQGDSQKDQQGGGRKEALHGKLAKEMPANPAARGKQTGPK
jgi:hypothetical protein